MFTRVGGATLALIAAASLALSIAGALGPLPGWWSGHPNVQGTLIRSKFVDIGLLGTRGCNTGGDRTCQSVEVPAIVATTGYVAAGATGLLAIASALLGIAAALQRERRKTLAKLAVFAVVVAGIVAIALIVQGPGLDTHSADGKLLNVSVPLGIGTYLFAGGMMSAILASVLAMRPSPVPRYSLPRATARPHGRHVPVHPEPAPVDMQALLQDDTLRPAALGPEPRMGMGRQTPGPGQPAFPGTGQMGAAQAMGGGAQPLFSAAPQLRPLYEAAPNLGGTGGFVPSSHAPRVMRAPTPIPRDQISARAGIPTPAAFDASGYGGADRGGDAEDEQQEHEHEEHEHEEHDPLRAAMAAFAAPPQLRRHSPSQPPPAMPLATPQGPVSRRGSTALGAPPAPTPTAPMLAAAPPSGSSFAGGPPPLFPGSPPPPASPFAGGSFPGAPPQAFSSAQPAPSSGPPPSPESRSPKTLPPPLRNKSISAPPLAAPAAPMPPQRSAPATLSPPAAPAAPMPSQRSAPATAPPQQRSGPATAPPPQRSAPATAPPQQRSGPAAPMPPQRSGPATAPPPQRSASATAPPPQRSAPATAPPPQPQRSAPAGPMPSQRSAPVAGGAASRPPPSPGPGGPRASPSSKPPPLGPAAGAAQPLSPAAPFVPTVPFPAPSAMARRAPRIETDPIERASTQAFSENDTQDRQEDSTLALLRGVGDATGLVEAPPDFDSKTAEQGLVAGRAGPQPDELVTGTIGKVNPTDLDLPLVKPPAAEDDAARAEPDAAPAEPAAARAEPAAARAEPAAEPKATPDRLSRGLRAFGFRPPVRDQAGRPRSSSSLQAEEPAGAFERPLTSPLIPPPAPASAAPASAAPAPTAPAPTAPAPTAASPAAGSPAPDSPLSEPASAGESAKLPISTAPSSLPPPSEKQSATSGPSPACPQCEAPMAWVEEHLRFYCKSCKMYF